MEVFLVVVLLGFLGVLLAGKIAGSMRGGFNY